MNTSGTPELPLITRLGGVPLPTWASPSSLIETRSLYASPFGLDEFSRRISRLRSRTPENVDVILVYRASSVEYLCGHTTQDPVPQPIAVFGESTALCVPDAELGRALASAVCDEILVFPSEANGPELLAAAIAARVGHGAVVGMAFEGVTAELRVLGILEAAGLVVRPLAWLVEEDRLTLSPAEQSLVRAAGRVTDLGYQAGVQAAAVANATDSDVAAAIASALISSSDSVSAFGPIVATGWRGGLTHSTFEGATLSDSGPTFLEFAGTVRRYHAPVMRTLAPRQLTGDMKRLEELSTAGLEAVIENLRPGVTASSVARAATAALGVVEPWVVFHYTFGYPVGLAYPRTWMDGAPFYIVEGNEGILEPGMAFHLPMSFRKLGIGCVGLSQTVIISETGNELATKGEAEVLILE